MNDEQFVKDNFNTFKKLITLNDKIISQIIQTKEAILKASKKGNKTIVIGNGGSAAISSHVSVDLTKISYVRAINFNESDLITTFGNDFGFEEIFAKAIEYYGDKGDVLIAISSSGRSNNIINACKMAKIKKFSSIITLSGFSISNPLYRLGDINLWVNNKGYNFIESIHHFWLLVVVNAIRGDAYYSA